MDAANGSGLNLHRNKPCGLHGAVLAAEEVVAAVSVAYGPAGRGVLVHSATGALTITRSALDILEAAFPPSSAPGPELVVLLQGARSLRQQAGDGVKSFLLTALALLRALHGLQRADAAGRVRAELNRAGLALSNAVPRGAPARPLDVGSVAEAILATRFARDVAAAVQPVVADLLRQAASDAADLQRLRKHLGVLCRLRHAAGRAVGDSALRDGVVLDGALRFVDKGPRRIVVLAGDEDDHVVDVRVAVRALLEDCAAAGDGHARPVLVVTSADLDDASLGALRMSGAGVLHRLAADEERFLLDWSLSGRGAVDVDVRPEPKGAVWLGLPDVKQLQVHAPTQQLAEQVGAAVRDAVQLACLTFNTAVPGNPLCPVGGVLERSLHWALGGTPLGRAELLRWHEHRGHDADAHPVVADLVSALDVVSPDVKKALAEAVAAVPRALPASDTLSDSPPCEPVALRVAVLQHALAVVGRLVGVDSVLPSKRQLAQPDTLLR